jgi:hypothetical protein
VDERGHDITCIGQWLHLTVYRRERGLELADGNAVSERKDPELDLAVRIGGSEAAQVSLFLVGEAGAAGRVLGVTAPGERVGEGFLQWTVRNPTARARLVSRAKRSAEDR